MQARGDAEVHHPRAAVAVDEDVRRLQVAVHHARSVRGMQRVENAQHHRDGFGRGQGAARLEVLRERRAGHVFEDEVRLLLVQVGLEDRHDVRMREPAHAARFLQPQIHVGRVRGGIGAHQLDRDFAFEARVEAEPHSGLCAFAEHPLEFEAAEFHRDVGAGSLAGSVAVGSGFAAVGACPSVSVSPRLGGGRGVPLRTDSRAACKASATSRALMPSARA